MERVFHIDFGVAALFESSPKVPLFDCGRWWLPWLVDYISHLGVGRY